MNFLTNIYLPEHSVTSYLSNKFNTSTNLPPVPYDVESLTAYLLYEKEMVGIEIEPCDNISFLLDRCILSQLPLDILFRHIDVDMYDILSALAFTMRSAIEDSNIEDVFYCLRKQQSLLWQYDVNQLLPDFNGTSVYLGNNLYILVFSSTEERRTFESRLDGFWSFYGD